VASSAAGGDCFSAHTRGGGELWGMAPSSFFLSFLSNFPLGLLCFVARRPSLQPAALEDRQTRGSSETGGPLVQWFVLL